MKPIVRKPRQFRLDPANPEVEQAADALLQSLTRVAWPVPEEKTPVKRASKRPANKRPAKRASKRPATTLDGSRRAKLDPDVNREIEKQRRLAEQARRKVIDEIEEHTVSRVAAYEEELPPALRKNTDAVREFFLKEINPLILASSLGAAQARDVVQRLLQTNVDLDPYMYFDNLIRKAVKIKLQQFVSKYAKITRKDLSALVESQKEVVLLDGNRERTDGSVSRPVRRAASCTSKPRS